VEEHPDAKPDPTPDSLFAADVRQRRERISPMINIIVAIVTLIAGRISPLVDTQAFIPYMGRATEIHHAGERSTIQGRKEAERKAQLGVTKSKPRR
jgi:hypothetical protein